MTALTNFLAICNEFKSQVQIEGPALTDTENQEKLADLIVTWCAKAQLYVEGLHHDWRWLRATKSFSTEADKYEYTLSDLSLSATLNLWDIEGKHGEGGNSKAIYKPGQSGGRALTWMEYETWRMKYQQWNTQTGPPTKITEDDDLSLILYPTPDDVYPLQVPYFLEPVRMVSKTSEPGIPTRYRDIICEYAKKYYEEYEDAPEISFYSSLKFNELLRQMQSTELRRGQIRTEGAGQSRHVKMRPFA